MLASTLHDYVDRAVNHMKKLIEEQVNWVGREVTGKLRGKGTPAWKLPKDAVHVRKLWGGQDKAMSARMKDKLRIFLKVASTHPHAPWIAAYHGMRVTKARKKLIDVARCILMGGYDYAVSPSFMACLPLSMYVLSMMAYQSGQVSQPWLQTSKHTMSSPLYVCVCVYRGLTANGRTLPPGFSTSIPSCPVPTLGPKISRGS